MTKKVLFALSILLGLAGFAAIPFIVGFDDVTRTVSRTGWDGVGLFLLNASLTLLLPAVGWWMIMRGEGIPATLGQAICAQFMGHPINLLTPSAYLGGEPLKTVYIARVCGVTKRRALATIIVGKVQEIAGLALMMLVSSIIYLWRRELTPTQQITVGIITGLMVLGMAGIMIGFFRNAQPTVKIINLLAWMGIARRRLARLRTKAEEMENLIHACFVHRWKTFIAAQAITCVSAVAIFFRPWIYFTFDPSVGTLGSEHLAAIYFVTNAINTVAFTPGGIGLFEGGVVAYFSTAGLGDANGVAYSLINRLCDITFIVIGGWLIVHAGLSKVAKGIAKGGEAEVIKPEDRPTPADL